jgi:hypothetical protein
LQINLERLDSILIIGRIRFGSLTRLRRYIGESNTEYLIKNGMIYVGKSYPDVWRITDKGIKRSKALENRFGRFIAWILWRLHLLS